jgi:hypothetical protein
MGVPVATIVCGGKRLPPETELIEIEIRREVNRVPEARLTLRDWVPGEGRFRVSDSGLFDPGARVSIALRCEGAQGPRGWNKTLFDGLVVRQRAEAREDGTLLHLELTDPAFKLHRQRNSAVLR